MLKNKKPKAGPSGDHAGCLLPAADPKGSDLSTGEAAGGSSAGPSPSQWGYGSPEEREGEEALNRARSQSREHQPGSLSDTSVNRDNVLACDHQGLQTPGPGPPSCMTGASSHSAVSQQPRRSSPTQSAAQLPTRTPCMLVPRPCMTRC